MAAPAAKAPIRTARRATRPTRGGLTINASGSVKGKSATLKFGSVSMTVKRTTGDELQRNVSLGQAALKKMKPRLVKPGVKLRASKAAPLFYADPANPRRLIRVLNGKREVGVFEDGVFKVIP